VSPDFLASDFIHEHELGPFLKDAAQGGVKILWIPVRESAYKQTPLKNYQAVLDPGKQLAGMPKAKRDQAWVRICEEIARAVKAPVGLLLEAVPSSAQRALPPELIRSSLNPREYAFVMIRDLAPTYKEFLTPMLSDQNLGEESELGILMVGSPMSERRNKNRQAQWTVFVKPDWLRWILAGQESGFRPAQEIPPDQTFGQVPGWPDHFFELLAAIVASGTSFQWQRSPLGHLILSQLRSSKCKSRR
jgi:hypothetical protein